MHFYIHAELPNFQQAHSQKILLGVLLKEMYMWTFSYCSHSANHSPGAVDELIFYGVCIVHIHEGLHVNSLIDHVYS